MTSRKFVIVFLACVMLLGCSLGEQGAPEKYRIERIELGTSSLCMKVGDVLKIKACAVPSTAKALDFQWSSSDQGIVAVSSGKVNAVSEGSAKITVSYQDVIAEIPVTVTTDEGKVLRIRLEAGEECRFANAAEYGLFIPEGKEKLKAVLVLQHGCGMEQFGITRPYDLQYRAFAKKWHIAVLETAVYGDCNVWGNPESGSAEALFRVLGQAGESCGHPELSSAPFLLFGHSGGGYWTLGMLRDYPERIIAAVCYSAAFDPQWEYGGAAFDVPVLLRHAGANDAPSALCEQTAKNTFKKLRSKEAPVAIAYNEGQNHNYSNLRYMAIPFYESAIRQRLSSEPGAPLRQISHQGAFLGNPDTFEVFPESGYAEDKSGLCFFLDEATAINWQEYVRTGTLSDKTAPPPPYEIKLFSDGDTSLVCWRADADVESGISKFRVYVNGDLVGTVPQEGEYQTFDRNGDNTCPVEPVGMRLELSRKLTAKDIIEVESINPFGLCSDRARLRSSLLSKWF